MRLYESQQHGIGLALIDRARQTRQDIAAWPHAAARIDTGDDSIVRARPVRGYPYRVVYTVESDVIVILAYAHEKRRPDYWSVAPYFRASRDPSHDPRRRCQPAR